MNDDKVFQSVSNELILREGFVSYGGLPGAIWTQWPRPVRRSRRGILAYRLNQTAYLAAKLKENGIPMIEPPGGHAIYIDAGALLPHLMHGEFPGQSLAVEMYLEGAIRGCEIGSSCSPTRTG